MVLTISIVSHRHGKLINNLLYSLKKYRPDITFEIIITYNVDDPEFIDFNGLKCPVKILKNSYPYGFGKNHNRAFTFSRGKYFCILNPDIIFVEDVFFYLINEMEHLNAGIIAPGIVDTSGKVQDNFRKLPTPHRLIAKCIGSSIKRDLVCVGEDGLAYPEFISGMFLLTRSSLFKKLKGFNESYFLYYEDVDLSLRCRLQGFPIVVDTKKTVIHDARKDSHRSLKYFLWHSRSAIHFFTSSLFWKMVWMKRPHKRL